MLLHGREVKFLRTVWAVSEISKVCPAHNINRFAEALKTEDSKELNDMWILFVTSLSAGYEMAQKFNEPGYDPRPVTVEEINTLTENEFNQLVTEATQAWIGDLITVEVEEPKKKVETSETSD